MLRPQHRPGEGTKFWLKVITELRNRGVRDLFGWIPGAKREFDQCRFPEMLTEHAALVRKASEKGEAVRRPMMLILGKARIPDLKEN